MARYRTRKGNKIRFVAVGAIAAAVFVGGFMLLRSHNKSVVLDAVTTPGARNDLRREHLKLLSEAISNYVGQVGKLPIAVPTAPTPICSGTGAVCKQLKLVDLMFVSSRGYVEALPNDPVGGPGQHSTGYTIVRVPASGELILAAPRAENGADITETVKYPY